MKEWKTDKVTLAAYLDMHFEVLRTEWDNGVCFWVFEDSDELADLVSEYIGGAVEANLKEYNSTVNRLKQEMFREKDRRDRRRRRDRVS